MMIYASTQTRETAEQAARRDFNRRSIGLDSNECHGHKARRRINLMLFGIDTAGAISCPYPAAELSHEEAMNRVREMNREDQAAAKREAARRRAAGLPQFTRN
ncbi:hypothetical protein [Novosphingobium panipatense]|uniref:Uncharacterized protein n=1 Tax=Novosphingobium panipatense TaxID=428991 RepID=A0ABY1PYG5_9SPHN|nr:hypothetical protein [Novosphingobium panipatense]SMP53018.1 hypothetical protein SAMN06296065_101357 [Novosphingobium panipatense]